MSPTVSLAAAEQPMGRARGVSFTALTFGAMLAVLIVAGLPRDTQAKAPAAGDLLAPASGEHMAAAGCPRGVLPWARPQLVENYAGYQVGGGNFLKTAYARCGNEGTWGWDYIGPCIPRFVQLGWWTRPRSQGGTGRYEPDGPRVLDKLAKGH